MSIPVCQPGKRETRLNLLLFSMLGLSCIGYWFAGFHLSDLKGRTGVFIFLALFGGLFGLYATAVYALSARRFCVPPKTVAWFIILSGITLRLLMVPAGISDGVTIPKLKADVTGQEVVFDRFLLYDHDVWRFLWDGHQQAVGLNPYRSAPAAFSDSEVDEASEDAEPQTPAPERERLLPDDHWRDIFENLNHKELPTVYPPGMQFAFRIVHAIAPGSIVAWKLFLLAIDGLVGVLLWMVLNRLNLPIWKLALYCWNPLVIKEGIGSGHADALVALMLVGLVLALLRAKPVEVSLWFAGAVLIKLAPIVLLPFLVSRMKVRGSLAALAVMVAACLPFCFDGPSLNGFSAYSREWVFNPGIFELIRWMVIETTLPVDVTQTARVISGLTFLTLIFLFRKKLALAPNAISQTMLLLVGGLLFFSPTVMPWYLLWVTPLAALSGSRSWIFYGGLCLLSYLIYADGSGIEPAWRLLVIHGGFLVAWCAEQWAARSRSPEAVHSIHEAALP